MSLDLVCDPNMEGEFRLSKSDRQLHSRTTSSGPSVGRPSAKQQPLDRLAQAAVAAHRQPRPRVFLGMVPAVSLANAEGARS